MDAGANVIRVNASHGSAEQRAEWIASVRQQAKERDLPIAVLVDLQGPRIRVGALSKPWQLEPGQLVVLVPEDDAKGDELPTTYDDLARDAKVGAKLLLNDGLLTLEVTTVMPPRVEARVVVGGALTSHKGMNLPGLTVSAPALTPKDREDVLFAVKHGVDYLALSFVRRAEDLEELRKLVPKTMKLVAKIEKDAALDDLERILTTHRRRDGRARRPGRRAAVRERCRWCRSGSSGRRNRHGKPVITATQMLESMMHAPRPTRAEASATSPTPSSTAPTR